jgi:hypothetical protein
MLGREKLAVLCFPAKKKRTILNRKVKRGNKR